MGINASELRKLAADLAQAGPQTGKRAQIVVRKVAKDIEADAKRMAPRDPKRPPKDPSRKVTGNLRNSITTSDLRTVGMSGTLSAEVGPTAAYGEYQELGTSTLPPRPFMGPAADRHAPAFEQAMAQLGQEALGG
jgi:HK97 gp10 family phage protein